MGDLKMTKEAEIKVVRGDLEKHLSAAVELQTQARQELQQLQRDVAELEMCVAAAAESRVKLEEEMADLKTTKEADVEAVRGEVAVAQGAITQLRQVWCVCILKWGNGMCHGGCVVTYVVGCIAWDVLD